jgi:hypothetical protein
MASDRPDPGEFLEMAQRMLRDLFSGTSSGEPWSEATRRGREFLSSERVDSPRPHHEPSAAEQRQNLTFALATRAVEALEDLALNVAAIRQRLERTEPRAPHGADGTAAPPDEDPGTTT